MIKNIGELNVDGIQITKANVIDWTLSRSYSYFRNDISGRKQFLVDLVNQVGQEITARGVPRWKLLRDLVIPMNEHRILFFSADRNLQGQISKSALSGNLNYDSTNEFRLVINNTAGNKMDFFLKRSVDVIRVDCENRFDVEFTLTNTATTSMKLPDYVKGRLDIGLPQGRKNSHRVVALLYGPSGSFIAETEDLSNGENVGFVAEELGRPVLGIDVELAASESKSFRAQFVGGNQKPFIYTQPLVLPQENRVVDGCQK